MHVDGGAAGARLGAGRFQEFSFVNKRIPQCFYASCAHALMFEILVCCLTGRGCGEAREN